MKKAAFLTLSITISAATWMIYYQGRLNTIDIESFCRTSPFEAVALFQAVFAICIASSIPSLPLNLAAGYLWGAFFGGILTSFGATLGGWLAFGLARYVFGQPLTKTAGRKWMRLVQIEFERSGWQFVALMRLNPIIPTGPLNYFLGLTSISSRSFLLTTFVSLCPPAWIVAYAGAHLRSAVSRDFDRSSMIYLTLTVTAALTLLSLLGYLAREVKRARLGNDVLSHPSVVNPATESPAHLLSSNSNVTLR